LWFELEHEREVIGLQPRRELVVEQPGGARTGDRREIEVDFAADRGSAGRVDRCRR
jgi:hypothetical protein